MVNTRLRSWNVQVAVALTEFVIPQTDLDRGFYKRQVHLGPTEITKIHSFVWGSWCLQIEVTTRRKF